MISKKFLVIASKISLLSITSFVSITLLPFDFRKNLIAYEIPLTGQRVSLQSDWVGKNSVRKDISILVFAGHADSQGMPGAGTAGEAVDLKSAKPLNINITDELYWNIKIRDAIVEIGKSKGLNINSYDPIIRSIANPNDPNTNWAVGAKHAKSGGYSLEIHFDSYGNHGFGSGLIPAFSTSLNKIDESLAKKFGRYPLFFRGVLGGPRRQIRILEIGKLEGKLEEDLRRLSSREETINQISNIVVSAFLEGIYN